MSAKWSVHLKTATYLPLFIHLELLEHLHHLLERGRLELPVLVPKLKGSVGEGPKQTNYSDLSSVRILSKFRNSFFNFFLGGGNFR